MGSVGCDCRIRVQAGPRRSMEASYLDATAKSVRGSPGPGQKITRLTKLYALNRLLAFLSTGRFCRRLVRMRGGRGGLSHSPPRRLKLKRHLETVCSSRPDPGKARSDFVRGRERACGRYLCWGPAPTGAEDIAAHFKDHAGGRGEGELTWRRAVKDGLAGTHYGYISACGREHGKWQIVTPDLSDALPSITIVLTNLGLGSRVILGSSDWWC